MKIRLFYCIIIALIAIVPNSYSQEIGYIEVGTGFDKQNKLIIGEAVHFYQSEITYTFKTYVGDIGNFEIVTRFIKFDGASETVYYKMKSDIDPEWTVIWNSYDFPNGEFVIKMYSSGGDLLGKSNKFKVTTNY